jgi:UDP-N-acetylglucosamine 2-epimerase (non-hydrolysing)
MSLKPRILTVIGTRPEAIKLAPVVQELRRRRSIDSWLVSTGQHRELLSQALSVFDAKVDIDLEVTTPGQTLEDLTCRTLQRMKSLLRELRPDWVIVQGDTTTAFASALAAFYEKVSVAHVEAGLRSHQRYAPFPEEVNRCLIDQLSELLFAPTSHARELLLGAGFKPETVFETGNTVVDALLTTREYLRRMPLLVPDIDPELLRGRKLILVTAQRRESFGEGIISICRALIRIVRQAPEALIVYPVQLNPSIEQPVRDLLAQHERIILTKPLPYLEFTSLLERAHLVLTDSRGIQEEAATFGKPLLVMRDVTERPEGVAAGVARLVGTSEQRIFDETMLLLNDRSAYESMTRGVNPYGDGTAARRIVDIIEASPRFAAQ